MRDEARDIMRLAMIDARDEHDEQRNRHHDDEWLREPPAQAGLDSLGTFADLNRRLEKALPLRARRTPAAWPPSGWPGQNVASSARA